MNVNGYSVNVYVRITKFAGIYAGRRARLDGIDQHGRAALAVSGREAPLELSVSKIENLDGSPIITSEQASDTPTSNRLSAAWFARKRVAK